MPVTWLSKGQPITADSTPIAELIAAHLGVKDTVGINDMLMTKSDEIVLRSDNKTAEVTIARGHSNRAVAYEKAIGVKAGLMKDLMEARIIKLIRVETSINPANIFTKAVTGRLQFERERRLCGLMPLAAGKMNATTRFGPGGTENPNASKDEHDGPEGEAHEEERCANATEAKEADVFTRLKERIRQMKERDGKDGKEAQGAGAPWGGHQCGA